MPATHLCTRCHIRRARYDLCGSCAYAVRRSASAPVVPGRHIVVRLWDRVSPITTLPTADAKGRWYWDCPDMRLNGGPFETETEARADLAKHEHRDMP